MNERTKLEVRSFTGPALGMFEVFGRTGPPIFRGPPFWTLTREPEMLQPYAFWEHTMQQNSTAAVTPSRTPLTAYT